jgi:hypothetical protein
MIGRMHISGDIENLSPTQRDVVIQAVSFYKRWRDIIRDPEVFHHTPVTSLQYPEGWIVMQMNNPDDSRILVGAWRLRDDIDNITVGLKHIDKNRKYRIESFPAVVTGEIPGKQLSNSLRINLEHEFSAVLLGIERLA